jgi:hypothetical protein
MKKHLALATLGISLAFALAAGGCKKEEPQNPSNLQGNNGYNNGQPNNGYGQPSNGQPNNGYGQPNNGQPTYGQPNNGQPTGQPTAQPTATATQPNIMGIPIPAGFPMMGGTQTGGAQTGGTAGGTTQGGGGQEVANNGMMASGGQQLLIPLQQQNAPGTQAASEALGGNLQEGQFIKTNVTLQPGKCYTGIAMASGPAEVIVELVAPAPLPPQVGSTSPQGPIAVFGAKTQCVKNPLPMAAPAIFRVTSKKGSAPVFAQLYAKLIAGCRRRRRASARGPRSGRRPRLPDGGIPPSQGAWPARRAASASALTWPAPPGRAARPWGSPRRGRCRCGPPARTAGPRRAGGPARAPRRSPPASPAFAG